MYKKTKPTASLISKSDILEGETIEMKINRIVNNGEPITDGAPQIFTERKNGVMPEYNPRTDKWDLAIDAMDKVHKTSLAKRDNVIKMPKNEEKKDGGAEPTQGTSETTD